MMLATLVFAAMVPMFVSAMHKNSGDSMRNMAMQVARDKIEKIRLLDYDQVNLTTLSAGVFGTTWTAEAGSARAKDFTITYTVNNIPLGAADGTEDHKLVKVSVVWVGAPFPHKAMVMQTDISRQFYGPAIVNLMSPNTTGSDTEQPQLDGGGVIDFIATVATTDLSTMTGNPLGEVDFVLTDANGNTVASGSTTDQLYPSYPTPGITGQYKWQWDSSGVASGTYTVTAIAKNGAGASGMAWSLDYLLSSNILPAPTNCQATALDASANLTWNAVTGADHYQVWRSTTSGAEIKVKDNLTAASYVDTGLTNGATYYYKIVAVDSTGQPSAKSNEASCTPQVGADVTAPSAPSGLVAGSIANTSLTLTWTASVDNPPPTVPSGVKVYEIFRSLNGTTWPGAATAAVNGNPPLNPPAATFMDSGLTAGTVYYYKIRAMDAAGNYSGFSPVLSVATTNVPINHTLTVTNSSNGNKTMTVTVVGNADGKYYDVNGNGQPSSLSYNISNKGTNYLVWTLRAGTYTVTAKYSSSTKQQTANLTVTDQPLSFSF